MCADELRQLQNTQRMEYREWVCKVHEDLVKKCRERKWRGREGEREGGREGEKVEREGEREGGREGGKEGEREGGR